MTFIDGVLAPGTIRGMVIVKGGMAYYTLGNYVAFLKPSNVGDMHWVAV